MNAAGFFQLSAYQHRDLFSDNLDVWQVLPRIKDYFSRFGKPLLSGEISPHALLQGDIWVGEGTVVEPGVLIQGPTFIGQNCQIRHGAYIRGNVITGENCVIGHATEVKNSIFLDGAKAPHFAYVGDSILGNEVNLGAGVKCANFKLDGTNVSIKMGDEKIDSGLRKFGAIIGDGTQIGCNSVTSPGTLIVPKATILPCSHIRGVYDGSG